jgi:uncharacterized protein YqhQ
MDSCIICYENKNLITPKNCKCKITFHEICLDKMKKSLNIDCPMCRNKIKIYNNQNYYINQNRYYNEDRIHPIINFIKFVSILFIMIIILVIFYFIFIAINFLSYLFSWFFF